MRSGVAGGDPAPNSCASAILRFDGATERPLTVLQGTSNEIIASAVPSSDGTRLVYGAEGCTDYFDWHLVVRDLQNGSEHTLGADAPTCHSLSVPSWSPDGTDLVFTWGPSPLAPDARPMTAGTCVPPLAGEVAVVPADQPGAPTSAEMRAATPGCGYVAAIYDHWGVAAVETCGDNGLAAASFVQLNPHLDPILQIALPPHADGVTLDADPSGSMVVIDEYQAPDSVAKTPSTEWLEVFDGHSLRTVVKDQTGVDSLAFATWCGSVCP